jgi:hypothetical protein
LQRFLQFVQHTLNAINRLGHAEASLLCYLLAAEAVDACDLASITYELANQVGFTL